MFILGIILTVLGFIIFQWCANAMSQPAYNRPLIFFKTAPVIIINLLWIGVLAGGLYCLWQVSYLIVLILIGGFAILWGFGFYMGKEKTRAKKIFKIYKQLKLYCPQEKERKILKETATIYFSNLRWDEVKINLTIDSIFEEKMGSKVNDVKELVNSIFIFENPSDNFGPNFNFEDYLKESEKRDKVIEKAYSEVLGEKTKVKERPVLSKETIKRMKKAGLNPDEMTNEQLAALESLEKVEKYHWFPKIIYTIGGFFGIWALISLLALNFIALVVWGIVAVILMYIGYNIQSRITSKKFCEASIQKYAYEQQAKVKEEQENEK